MKKSKTMIAGFMLLGLAAFQGCQNCDQVVTDAQSACEQRINAVQDSLRTAWTQQADQVKSEYDARLRTLDSTFRASNPGATAQ